MAKTDPNQALKMVISAGTLAATLAGWAWLSQTPPPIVSASAAESTQATGFVEAAGSNAPPSLLLDAPVIPTLVPLNAPVAQPQISQPVVRPLVRPAAITSTRSSR